MLLISASGIMTWFVLVFDVSDLMDRQRDSAHASQKSSYFCALKNVTPQTEAVEQIYQQMAVDDLIWVNLYSKVKGNSLMFPVPVEKCNNLIM